MREIELTLSVILIALSLTSLIFFVLGVNPILVYFHVFKSFLSFYGLSEIITKCLPLILCACGLAFCFRAGVWNIGCEGQILLGAIATTWLALFSGIPPTLAKFLAVLLSFLAGSFWAGIAGLLKARLNVNEIIVTLMLNYIALNLVNHLVYGPWKGSEEWGFPYTNEFPDSFKFVKLPGTRIHVETLALSLLALLGLAVARKTKLWYEIKVVGSSRKVARYAGMSIEKIILLVMLISGGLAGVAGAGEVAGIHHRLKYGEQISAGYGYASIIVAWLGKLRPVGILLASLFYSSFLVGSDALKVSLGLSHAVVSIFNASFLFAILLGEFIRKKVEKRD